MCSSNYEALHFAIFFSGIFLLSSKAVISNLDYAYPQGYEPGYLGVLEKIYQRWKKSIYLALKHMNLKQQQLY